MSSTTLEGSKQVALVVGGGIGGLAAALALHKEGFDVRVFEQAITLSEVGAGINLLPAGTAVLHSLGLEEALKEASVGDGVQTSELIYCAPKGTIVMREKRGLAAGNPTPQYSIHRGYLHRMLLKAVEERIGQGNIHSGHQFLDFTQNANSVVANFSVAQENERRCEQYSGKATFTGKLLVGADGIRSRVRAQMHPGEKANFTGWRIYRGVVEVDHQFCDGKTMLCYGSGKAVSVLYPISDTARKAGKTLLNWGLACNDEILAADLRGAPGEESWSRRVPKTEFRSLIENWVFPKETFVDANITFASLVDATADNGVSCYALFDRDPVPQWTSGRVTLLGDAAHPLLPFGSQGAGQAMLDVEALQAALCKAKGDVCSGLQQYAEARATAAGNVVLTNRQMGPTRVLRMFDDAVGHKDVEEQVQWVAEHSQQIKDCALNYHKLSGLTKAPIQNTPFKGSTGFGTNPVVLVVDFCKAYTDPASDFYCGDPKCGVVAAVQESIPLLTAARVKKVPVIFTRVVFSKNGLDRESMFCQKVPKLKSWTEDNPLTCICPELGPVEGETVIIKQHPSCFFGTSLLPVLNSLRIDTILLIGCSTSGCIRATALDGMCHGFRVIIPRECVGDRTQAVHDANLFDTNAKICDVLPKQAVMEYLSCMASPSNQGTLVTESPVPQKSPATVAADNPRPDGVTDFKKGQRDFTPSSGQAEAAPQRSDLNGPTKVFTNGVTAKNRTQTFSGPLTEEAVWIPDVNSGYPKAFRGPDADDWFDPGELGHPDALEWRRKFGVIIPSTNTIVEHDYWRMIFSNPELQGVGFHMAGILISSPKLGSDSDMLEFLAQFRREIFKTVDQLCTAEPEYIIMGMSLETFFGGWEGNKELEEEITGRSGLCLATGARACKSALEKFKAKTIAVITPYQEIGDRNVVKFFEEIGFKVARIRGLKCGSATDIAHVPESFCETIIKEQLDGPDIDAIVQCGTNLSMVALADRLEHEIKKPIIAINAATLWFALRQNLINEKIFNATRLLREF